MYDLEAKTIASLTGLNRNTVNRYLTLIRKRIAEFCEQQYPVQGEIEVDESYFGGKRIKGKWGRGALKKTPIFGIFKSGGKVYTEVVPDCAKATLQAIIRGHIDPELNALIIMVLDVDLFVRMHVFKEVSHSSRIEGTRTRMDEAGCNNTQINLLLSGISS